MLPPIFEKGLALRIAFTIVNAGEKLFISLMCLRLDQVMQSCLCIPLKSFGQPICVRSHRHIKGEVYLVPFLELGGLQ